MTQVGKITILYSSGFLVIYALFVIVVIVTNKYNESNRVPDDNKRRASIFLETAADQRKKHSNHALNINQLL